MCGISGILSYRDVFDENCIHRMNHIQKHRGPDDTSFYKDDHILMGHNRLTIIDVAKRSNQPMQIENTIIIFNGEVYNYVELKQGLISKGVKFITESDTEVILQMYKTYGESCLEYFRGMFAFAIWDKESKKLFCARDRMGIKPFYFANKRNTLIFSSEIKAILCGIDAKPNYDILKRYLIQGIYLESDKTFFDGIYSLEPAHFMVVEKGSTKIKRYWDVGESEKFSNEEEAKGLYFDEMLRSINLRLRSDVPIGINVSSGLDSSVLLGGISRSKDVNLKAYTYTCMDTKYDEAEDAGRLAVDFGHIWNKVVFEEREFYPSLLNAQLYQEEPYGGLPCLAHSKIFDLAKAQGVSVILCGVGMDEQWAGYDYYAAAKNKDLDKVTTVQGTSNPICVDVLNHDFVKGYEPLEYPNKFVSKIDNLKYRDMFYSKIPRGLRFLDRMSMKSGVELRVPFLDHKLIELSFKMPENYLIRDGVQKYLLRDMAKNLIPQYGSNVPKKPLQTPMREWLGRAPWVKDILFSESFKNRGIFNEKRIKSVYNGYMKGDFDNSFFLWQWINTEIWFRVFIDGEYL